MRNILKRLEAMEQEVRDLDVTVKFRDQRTDVKMELLQAAKLLIDGDVCAIYAHDYNPEYNPLSELSLDELRALLTIVEEKNQEVIYG